ncbi:hypothetical protein [uncultured Comamonas sp.]|uniref:hypothetical protein n=1 Tax=uncultured Comamonas sp. TaxID=114710 RepID=UPI0025CDF80A|nr:hypothetical protein [uncultured Comamonas sp.]
MGHYDPGGWQRENPFTGGRNEMSFFTKFILTIVVLLIGVLAYKYQAVILGFFVVPPVAVPQQPSFRPLPEATVIAPRVLPPEQPRSESAGQIYRCGNTYSNTPCEGGKQIAQQSSLSVEASTTKEIYLCKDFHGNLTWESTACSVNSRFIERIARVPANISWDDQVAIARHQRNRAHANSAEQVVPVATRPTGGKANASECRALDERVNWLDNLGRIGGGGYTMDWIREERRKARDRQFRIGC